jgi:uncharacterized protein (TIGR00369 family)
MDTPTPEERPHPVIERMARRRAQLGASLTETLGTRLVAVSGGRAVVELDFTPQVQQLTGAFHAGALTALADNAATAACLSRLPEDALDAPEKFPVSINFTINLVGNANSGTARAEAQVPNRRRSPRSLGLLRRCADPHRRPFELRRRCPRWGRTVQLPPTLS